jgi:hypothetical protein
MLHALPITPFVVPFSFPCQTPEHEISCNSMKENWICLRRKRKSGIKEHFSVSRMYLKHINIAFRSENSLSGSRGVAP